jgi:hypothetical protein
MSVEALNAGVAPGQSEVVDDGAAEQLRRMRRMAFVPGTSSTGGFRLTENVSRSYVSEATSEYGLHPSSSSSSDDDAATSEAAASAQGATSRPQTAVSSAAVAAAGREGQRSGEIGAIEGIIRRTRSGHADE